MKGKTVKSLCILIAISLIVGCQAADSKEEITSSEALTTLQEVDSHSHESEHNHVHDEETEKIYAAILKIAKYMNVRFRIGRGTGNLYIHIC